MLPNVLKDYCRLLKLFSEKEHLFVDNSFLCQNNYYF